MIINSQITKKTNGNTDSVIIKKTSSAPTYFRIRNGEWGYIPNRESNTQYYMCDFYKDDGTKFYVNFSDSTDWRVLSRFKVGTMKSSGTHNVLCNSSADYPAGVCLEVDSNKYVGTGYSSVYNVASTNVWVFFQYPNFTADVWYYICSRYYNGVLYISLYDDDGVLLGENHQTVNNIYNRDFNPRVGGINISYFTFNGEVDLSNTVYEKDGTVLWGQLTDITRTMGKIELLN